MNYKYIVNPQNRKYVSLNSKKGINILKLYLKSYFVGGASTQINRRSRTLSNLAAMDSAINENKFTELLKTYIQNENELLSKLQVDQDKNKLQILFDNFTREQTDLKIDIKFYGDKIEVKKRNELFEKTGNFVQNPENKALYVSKNLKEINQFVKDYNSMQRQKKQLAQQQAFVTNYNSMRRQHAASVVDNVLGPPVENPSIQELNELLLHKSKKSKKK